MSVYVNTPLLTERAKELLALSIEDKEIATYGIIEKWFIAWNGKCYVSFSGGKDSTVLAYLVANWLAHFKTPPYSLVLVFVNTGLEYPEVQRFVNEYAAWLRKEFARVQIELVRLRPKLNVCQVVSKYGYSVISKEVADNVWLVRKRGNEKRLKRLRGELLTPDGKKSPFCCEKWAFLLHAPFLVSGGCCRVMKKAPAHSYENASGRTPMTATMALESRQRMSNWKKTGCNAFAGKRPVSKPMSFWSEQDVLRFIVDRKLPVASVYGEIVSSDGYNDYDVTLLGGSLRCTGCQRTGCIFCGFGAHLERGETRFERMKHTHPKHYDFCINGGAFDPVDGLWKPNEKGLGYGRVLDYVGVRF